MNPENNAPDKPEIGGKWIVVFIVVECNFSAIDPDGDDVRYHIDWDDGENDVTDFYSSGEEVTLRHVYSMQGDFTITIYAEDIHGATGPENTFKPGWKNKALNVNPIFVNLMEQFPLLWRLFSSIF